MGIALGYEDLIDHDELRHDPVMAILAGKREARRSDCAPLAGKSTLNARLAFERSARQAGFFEHGDDRLVAPLVVTSPADGERVEDASRPTQIVEAVGSARGVSHAAAQAAQAVQRHKLIDGLFQELPEPHAEWGTAERVRWLRLAASMFDVLYDRPDTLVAIEIRTVVEGSDGETG